MPDLHALHFLHPAWLLALPLLALLWWFVRQGAEQANPWRRVVDPDLLPVLLANGEASGNARARQWLLATGWLIAVIALAGPVWEKKPLPVFRAPDALVVVLDLSRSMNTPDLRPSRLVRARFKVRDLLRRRKEGQTGLVVFAGDAFAVTPLTTDTATIVAQLSPLAPELMPVQGSRVDLGLEEAEKLLQQAGAGKGRVLLVTDGFSDAAAIDVAGRLRDRGYRLSVLGVGTPQGAPLPDGRGGFVRDARGAMVTPGLDEAALRRLAGAGGGSYLRIRADDSDLGQLLPERDAALDAKAIATGQKADRWREYAPWLLLPLALIGSLTFRRGWLLGMVLLSFTITPPRSAWADTPARTNGTEAPALAWHRLWRDMWQRPDQQAAAALAAGDAARSAQLAESPARRGAALYRKGDYVQALAEFKRAEKAKEPARRAQALYNKGNALARIGRLEDAIAAYDQALQQQPELTDAEVNRQLLRELLHKQQQRRQKYQDGKQKKQPGDVQQSRQQGKQGQQRDSQQGQGKKQQGGSQQKGKEQQEGGQQGQPQKQQAGEQGSQQKKQHAGGQQGQQKQQRQGAGSKNSKDGKPGSTDKAAREGTAPARDFRQALKSQRQAEQEHKEALGKEQQEAQHRQSKGDARPGLPASSEARGLSSEERMAAEQWLKRIPDDPGGLLRRKFQYQYQKRRSGGERRTGDVQSW